MSDLRTRNGHMSSRRRAGISRTRGSLRTSCPQPDLSPPEATKDATSRPSRAISPRRSARTGGSPASSRQGRLRQSARSRPGRWRGRCSTTSGRFAAPVGARRRSTRSWGATCPSRSATRQSRRPRRGIGSTSRSSTPTRSPSSWRTSTPTGSRGHRMAASLPAAWLAQRQGWRVPRLASHDQWDRQALCQGGGHPRGRWRARARRASASVSPPRGDEHGQ